MYLQLSVLYGKLVAAVLKFSRGKDMRYEATSRTAKTDHRSTPAQSKSIATLPRKEFIVCCGKQRVVTISNRNKNACFPRVSFPRSRMVFPPDIIKINRQPELVESVLSPSESAGQLQSIANFYAFLLVASWTCFCQNGISLERAGLPGGCS